jgi:hypothetical protein
MSEFCLVLGFLLVAIGSFNLGKLHGYDTGYKRGSASAANRLVDLQQNLNTWRNRAMNADIALQEQRDEWKVKVERVKEILA